MYEGAQIGPKELQLKVTLEFHCENVVTLTFVPISYVFGVRAG